jgi:hypothetical protein
MEERFKARTIQSVGIYTYVSGLLVVLAKYHFRIYSFYDLNLGKR